MVSFFTQRRLARNERMMSVTHAPLVALLSAVLETRPLIMFTSCGIRQTGSGSRIKKSRINHGEPSRSSFPGLQQCGKAGANR